MKLKHLMTCTVACTFAGSASACEYFTTFLGRGDSSWISSLITAEYCKKYPKDKFKIVVVNNGDSDGRVSMGHATAFVSPNFKDPHMVKAITQFGNSTYSDSNGGHSGEQLRRMATEDAVRQLMRNIGR